MEDLRGMYLVESNSNKRNAPPTLIWLAADGLYQSPLVHDPSGAVTATPAPETSTEPSEAPEATRRPRRTTRP